MSGTAIVDSRVARLTWEQGLEPRPELIDAIIKHHRLSDGPARDWAATLWGALLGALIGVLLKGMTLAQAPWGPNSGTVGVCLGCIAVIGAGLSVIAAALAATRARRHPSFFQFASINFFMVTVVQLA